MTVGAFSDVRVLDLSDRLSGAYCARLFADLGAEVLLLEPVEGHALRHEPPFLDDRPGPERSLLHAYVNRNKQSRVMADDEAAIAECVDAADIVVTTSPRPWPSALRTALARWGDDTIHVSVTPYGLEGPLAAAPGNNLTACALSGWADLCGNEGEGPLQLPPHQVGYLAGVAAFVGAAAALLRRSRTGRGALVDASEVEALAIIAAPWALDATYEGPNGVISRAKALRRDRPEGRYAALDGEIVFSSGRGSAFGDAMNVLGLHDLAADERYVSYAGQRPNLAEFRPRIEERIAQASRWRLFQDLSQVRATVGVIQDTADLLQNEQFDARDYLVATSLEGRALAMPGAPARLSATPWEMRTPAPRLDEHRAARWSTTHTRADADERALGDEAPLAGVRVLSLTKAWSGPFGTELLALLGADVVQIEARSRPDIFRVNHGGYEAGASVTGPVADSSRRQRPWNVAGLYNSVNLNKRAITLDMTDPRGVDLFWRLVPRFDVIAGGLMPHVLPSWGVTYETLRERRPDVIFASLTGYGETGPYATYSANGSTIEPMSGLTSLHGYEGGPPQATGGLLPDPVGGYYLAAAILVALDHRARTGEGQRVDLSMLEAMAAHLGDAILERSVDGPVRGPAGNRHPRVAPHGIYAASGGEWLALAAETDAAWRALAEHMGRPDLADSPRFAVSSDRKRHEEELDATIGAWCADQAADATANALAALGVSAARVTPLDEVYVEPHAQMTARGFFVDVEHPEAGVHTQAVAPWRFDGRPVNVARHSPTMGEHSFEIFRDELGLDRSEYEELVAAGITGDMPPD